MPSEPSSGQAKLNGGDKTQPVPAPTVTAGTLPHATGNTRRRRLAVGSLVFLGSLMLCVAIFATWVDRAALDPSTWSDTSTKALRQPAVRTELAEYLGDQVHTLGDARAAVC